MKKSNVKNLDLTRLTLSKLLKALVEAHDLAFALRLLCDQTKFRLYKSEFRCKICRLSILTPIGSKIDFKEDPIFESAA